MMKRKSTAPALVLLVCSMAAGLGCLSTQRRITETAGTDTLVRDEADPIKSRRLELTAHRWTESGALEVKMVTPTTCEGQIINNYQKREITKRRFVGSVPCSTGFMVAHNVLGLGLSGALIGVDYQNDQGLLVAGIALLAVPLTLDLVCGIQYGRRGPYESKSEPASRPTGNTEDYTCERPNGATGKRVEIKLGKGSHVPLLVATTDAAGVASFDPFRYLDAHDPPDASLSLQVAVEGLSEPVSYPISATDVAAAAAGYLRGREIAQADTGAPRLDPEAMELSIAYDLVEEGRELEFRVGVKSSGTPLEGVYASLVAERGKMSPRYLYFGKATAADYTGDAVRVEAPEGVGLPPFTVVLRQAGQKRELTRFGVATDAMGGLFGDWASGPDRTKGGAKTYRGGARMVGKVDGGAGDHSDWWVLDIPTHGRVTVQLEGAAELGQLERGVRTDGASGLADAFDVETAGEGSKRRLTFIGGGGRYFYKISSLGAGRADYRVTAGVEPMPVEAKAVSMEGVVVELDKGGIHGVYIGRTGELRYKSYHAGRFVVERVEPSRSFVKVISGLGDVRSRMPRISALMR